MNANNYDWVVSRIASAIGEPARVRILDCLVDGHARTSTELATVAAVSPSTASAHLNRLRAERLIKLFPQGRHRYYSLDGPDVAQALEALNVIAGRPLRKFVPNTPSRLLLARTCYDHIAGKLGVLLHNQFKDKRWMSANSNGSERAYDVTLDGARTFAALGIDVEAVRRMRRRFAFACLDWSERQPHIGGALGAALLNMVLERKWVVQDLDCRALDITRLGKREIENRFGICL